MRRSRLLVEARTDFFEILGIAVAERGAGVGLGEDGTIPVAGRMDDSEDQGAPFIQMFESKGLAGRTALPPQLHVFVRDWLSSNNVLLKSKDGHVLIDSGYGRHAPMTLRLLASARALGEDSLSFLVNTHCHSDHVGGNAAIARKYDCPIAVPAAEAPLVERWDGKALLYDYCDHRVEHFIADRVLPPNSTHVWGDLEWAALAAPGHDMGALVFYNAEHRILISGDALWENGFGFVMPPEVDPAAMPAARATLGMLAKLDVRLVIPGHGEPFDDIAGALDRARKRIDAFEADSLRVARHALKVNLMFSLLDKQRMSLSELPAYLDRVGIYREFNALYFKLSPARLAELLVGELVKSKAATIDAGSLVPAFGEAG
jgi:glyoxylase-like metal-dependent hydrolase (beta-lactamase superfamily II)